MKLDRLVLWVAQGFGTGRIPWAPGTFGSLVGVIWWILLLAPGNFWVYLAGTCAGLGLSIWLCGRAESFLRQHDPPSVVLDEISAIPVCFCGPIVMQFWRSGHLSPPADWLAANSWPACLGFIAAFRLFDILKPWPIRQSQSMPGGWGITVDDFLAALYVNLVWLVVEIVSHPN